MNLNDLGAFSRVRGPVRKRSTKVRDERFFRQLKLRTRSSTRYELTRALAELRNVAIPGQTFIEMKQV